MTIGELRDLLGVSSHLHPETEIRVAPLGWHRGYGTYALSPVGGDVGWKIAAADGCGDPQVFTSSRDAEKLGISERQWDDADQVVVLWLANNPDQDQSAAQPEPTN